MTFNSFEFIFIFLPSVLVIYFAAAKKINPAVILISASIIFYGIWNWNYLPLLLVSILINYYVGLKIENSSQKKFWLSAGIIFNFAVLSYYKLTKFLPLGISFWTFAQVSYLVEIYRENIKSLSMLEYSNTILFFPVITSGPIVNFNNEGG